MDGGEAWCIGKSAKEGRENHLACYLPNCWTRACLGKTAPAVHRRNARAVVEYWVFYGRQLRECV